MMPQEEVMSVKMLAVPTVDKTREFNGIAKLKIDKKDRHMATLHEFSKFLERSNESLVQETLKLSRDIRETLEEKEIEFQKFYKTLEDDEFLIVKSEPEILHLLKETKIMVKNRSNIVEKYSADLDGTETKRSAETGAELKALVDKLIAIAHSLPDDIEHIVEAEAFDINTEIINNKKSHANTMAGLRIAQVKIEAESIQRWEIARARWRQLRHDKALADFQREITSDLYFDPQDRQDYMASFQRGQEQRHQQVKESLNVLKALNCSNISSEAVVEEQNNLVAINESEIVAIKDCFDSLNLLNNGTNQMALDRVEALRREIHEYGALKLEPDLKGLSAPLQKAVNDESLSELWRLGGGLKPDLVAQIADMTGDAIIYPATVQGMQERLELIVCSFPLKALEEERGKAAQLDKLKTLNTKMKSVPRVEVPGVLRTLVPELEDVVTVEALPELFKNTVREIITEIGVELIAYEKRLAAAPPPSASLDGGTLGTAGAAGGATLGATHGTTATAAVGVATKGATAIPPGTSGKTAKTVTIAGVTGTKKGGSTMSGTTAGKTKTARHDASRAGTSSMSLAVPSIDFNCIKSWNRKLGILFYGSDLPAEVQTAVSNALEGTLEQKECNRLVDAVIFENSDRRLKTINRKYKKHINNIVTYLENQANNLSVTSVDIGDFYLQVAKIIEAHRKIQIDLDNKSADEIWDLKEEFRFELEDREAAYEAACQQIREATKQEDLQEHFNKVLEVLEGIQQSYRNYHSNACFASDKYPLMLMQEFYQHLNNIANTFYLHPRSSHLIITRYEALFDQTIKFNRKYFEADPVMAVGFERIAPNPPPEEWEANGEPFTTANPTESLLNGPCSLKVPHTEVLAKFKLDAYFAPPDPNLVEETAEETPKVLSESALALLRKEPHPKCPWVANDSAFLPVSEEVYQSMEDDDERNEYSAAIAKSFINLDSADPAVPSPALAALSPEDLALYTYTKELVLATKERQKQEAEPSYIMDHPPQDLYEKLWIRLIEISDGEVNDLWRTLRESVFLSLEAESFSRLAAAVKVNDERKDAYTETLEEQIRQHWPRRGRVETQIKQPREAELLGHKEKTWRHIQNIQQKMIETEAKFNAAMAEARGTCDAYIQDMTALRNSLNGDSFKNLASLQGVDVKARSTTITFQSQCVTQAAALTVTAEQDTAAISVFGRDFRKICPPQVPGQEGGYSQSEINEIEVLVEGQCAEIDSISQEWQILIAQLKEQQEQSLKCQEEFKVKYDKCVQDLSMSEGLGQKYGAPRRRAQERIRTEVGKDETAAGLVDEMLAKLEFICSEAQQKEEAAKNGVGITSEASVVSLSSGSESLNEDEAEGLAARQQLGGVTTAWILLNELRTALQIRAVYLNIVLTPLQMVQLPWMPAERIALGDVPFAVKEFPVSKNTLEEVFEEVDAACRKETKDLYTSEGRQALLGTLGIPESLQIWLTESKNKILGRHGHREKAWKRYWSQVERSEALLARNLAANDINTISVAAEKYSIRLGIPAISMKSLAEAFMVFVKRDKAAKIKGFTKLLAVWEKGREKHERLLRPKLGSPDMVDELNSLNSVELQRSDELVQNVHKFRSMLIRALVEHLLKFVEDLGVCTKGMIQLSDSTMRLETVQVPPDTNIPKKHMTMKKLRKAQRIAEAIAAGEEDRSQTRTWPPVDVELTTKVVKECEDMVKDLGSNAADTGMPSPRSAAAAAAAAIPDKKGSVKKSVAAPAAANQGEKPTLITSVWLTKMKENSEVNGRVGTAQRILITERDAAVNAFAAYIGGCLGEIRVDYDTILSQEASWNERWTKQVEMLRAGNV